MGTRHQQTVINKKGQIKLSQYGQWDGYPKGQGLDILNYLRSGNLKKYQTELEKLREITDSEAEIIESITNWQKDYPYLSRDCGSDIHAMIENGQVKFVTLIPDREAEQWCEGFYVINFNTGIFSTEYHGKKTTYPLSKLPTDKTYLSDNEIE